MRTSTMGSALNAAVAYDALGFNVIPLCPDDQKRPALAAWKPYRERRVTAEELRRWFGSGSRGLAVICGRVSGGLTVIDIDDADLGDRFLGENGGLLESTLCARTGGGNLHVYLRVPFSPAKFTLRRHDPPQPIDIQGEGSYVVMPPSMHASGRRYEWLDGCGKEVRTLLSFDVWLQGALARIGVTWLPRAARIGDLRPAPVDNDAASEVITMLRNLAGEAGRLRGNEVWFCCPFHDDWVASLSANTERPVWHCFGCAEGGGIGRLKELRRGRRPR